MQEMPIEESARRRRTKNAGIFFCSSSPFSNGLYPWRLLVRIVRALSRLLLQALGAIQSVEDNARIKALVNGEDSCKMIDPWPPNTCLPFLLTDGLIVQLLDPLQKQIIENEAGNHVLPEAAEDGSVSCVDCGRTCNCSREFGNGVADEDLRRYQEQLTALDCADAVSRDIDSSAYPVCNTVIKPSLNNHKKSACNLRTRHDCLSGMAKGLSINMLRLVTSAFINGFERWLLQKEGPSLKVFKLEEMFTCVEAFKLKQDQLIYLQRSMLRASTAQKQVVVDGTTNKTFISTVCILEQLYLDRSKERMQRIVEVAEHYDVLLKQINLLLEYLYAQGHTIISQLHSHHLCTKLGSDFEYDDAFAIKRQLQTAVSLWLLLYHDVSHSVTLI